MKKQMIILLTIVVLFIFFLYSYLSPRSYVSYYIVDGYKVTEKYNGKYIFEIIKDNQKYKYLLDTKYHPSRDLIKKIDTFKENKDICIYINVKNEKTSPLCYRDNQLIDFRLINNDLFTKFLLNKYKNENQEINKKIDNIIVHNYDNSIYALWNYHSLIYINQENNREIKLFDNDQYENKLTILVNDLLFIPNYNQKFFFDEAVIINLNDGTKEFWKLKTEINYESNILGIYDNDFYLIDEKEGKEYRINIIKKTIENITTEEGFGLIYNQGQWEEEKISNIINKKIKFIENNKCNYYIKNDMLYYEENLTKNNYLISLHQKPKIILNKNCQIYYLVEDVLYTYYPQIGEIKLLSNYDWKFTADNKVFIYKK